MWQSISICRALERDVGPHTTTASEALFAYAVLDESASDEKASLQDHAENIAAMTLLQLNRIYFARRMVLKIVCDLRLLLLLLLLLMLLVLLLVLLVPRI